MCQESKVIVVTTRCWDCYLPSSSWQIGLYFTYIERVSSQFFMPFFSVMDDFGNLVKVGAEP